MWTRLRSFFRCRRFLCSMKTTNSISLDFIMKYHAPSWFTIKCNPSILDGSKNLFRVIHRCKSVSPETQDIVLPVIQNNAYLAHSECVLLSMLVDDDPNMRKLALLRILKARQSENSVNKRVYALPCYKLWGLDFVGNRLPE